MQRPRYDVFTPSLMYLVSWKDKLSPSLQCESRGPRPQATLHRARRGHWVLHRSHYHTAGDASDWLGALIPSVEDVPLCS